MTKRTIILSVFIVLKFLLQILVLSPDYDLQRDEYLHLDQANHLAWGFLSVPPFISWTSYLISLADYPIFLIKFFPALYGALTIYIVWKTIETLQGNMFALILGSTCMLFSVLLRLNTLYQPNSLDVLCWTMLYYAIIQFLNTEKSKWLYIGACIFAIGFLNKYNIIFILIGLFPVILSTTHRKIFLKIDFYLAVLFGLILVSPNLIWQYKNDFPTFHHLSVLRETQLVHVDRMDFIKSQFLFYLGGTVVLIASFYALLVYKPFVRYRFFFLSFMITMSTFIYLKAKDYYAIGIYPVYLAFGSVYLASLLKSGWTKHLQLVIVAIPILVFIPMYNVVFPNKSPEYIIQHTDLYKKLGMLRWEDGRDHFLPQDFADMLGWK